MSTSRKRILCYHIYDERRSGSSYVTLIVRTFYAETVSISERIEGTIDNRAGYGSPEVAARLGGFFQRIQDAGHAQIFDPMMYGSPAPSTRFRWLTFPAYGSSPGSYSDCDIEFGDTKLMDVIHGARFVKGIAMRIGRARNKAKGYDGFKAADLSNYLITDPATFIDALDQMGAKKVKRFQGSDSMGEWVADPSPRPWLLTDTLWRTFNHP